MTLSGFCLRRRKSICSMPRAESKDILRTDSKAVIRLLKSTSFHHIPEVGREATLSVSQPWCPRCADEAHTSLTGLSRG